MRHRRCHASLIIVLVVGIGLQAPTLAKEQEFAELGICHLESGATLAPCTLGYRTLGTLNSDQSNAILVPTWYTGTSEESASFIAGVVDTTAYFVVVVDAFGNGVSTSPTNSPTQGGASFPDVSIGDMVNAQYRFVTETLRLTRLHAVIGASMGGMQTFEWLVAYPGFVDKGVPLIGSPRLGSFDVAVWETHLRILNLIEDCMCQDAAAVLAGTGTMLGTSSEWVNAQTDPSDVASTLEGRAQAILESPPGWTTDRASQTNAMLDHDVSRSFGGDMAAAAEAVEAEVFSVVVRSDHIVTPSSAIDFVDMVGGESLILEDPAGHGAIFTPGTGFEAQVRSFLDGTNGD